MDLIQNYDAADFKVSCFGRNLQKIAPHYIETNHKPVQNSD
jgi:hypothetical protein